MHNLFKSMAKTLAHQDSPLSIVVLLLSGLSTRTECLSLRAGSGGSLCVRVVSSVFPVLRAPCVLGWDRVARAPDR